jgi:hypothetical protein
MQQIQAGTLLIDQFKPTPNPDTADVPTTAADCRQFHTARLLNVAVMENTKKRLPHPSGSHSEVHSTDLNTYEAHYIVHDVRKLAFSRVSLCTLCFVRTILTDFISGC